MPTKDDDFNRVCTAIFFRITSVMGESEDILLESEYDQKDIRWIHIAALTRAFLTAIFLVRKSKGEFQNVSDPTLDIKAFRAISADAANVIAMTLDRMDPKSKYSVMIVRREP